jgi:hypothetical protein
MNNLITILILLLTTNIYCQLETTKSYLTSNSSNTWKTNGSPIFTETDSICIYGINYIFSINDSLTIRKCLNNHLSETKHLWKLRQEGTDIIIVIDEKKYQLNIKQKDKKIRLRTYNLKENNPINDLILVNLKKDANERF